MKAIGYALLATGIIVIAILGTGSVLAQTRSAENYAPLGGGQIAGYVLGFDMYDQLQPIEWASVIADNGQFHFVAYTGSNGWYSMFVPEGVYNVTVSEPGYRAYSNTVAVSDGSASTINFYLEESHVPVPEFPTGMASTIAIISMAAALIVLKLRRRKQ
jgi:hypothetical protein